MRDRIHHSRSEGRDMPQDNEARDNQRGNQSEMGGLGHELLGKWQSTIEQNSRELIQKVDDVGSELTQAINRQLTRRPWIYLGSAASLGILLGFMIAKPGGLRQVKERSHDD